jgi:hypothetical protein
MTQIATVAAPVHRAQDGDGLRAADEVYSDSLKSREKFLAFRGLADSDGRMIRGGFSAKRIAASSGASAAPIDTATSIGRAAIAAGCYLTENILIPALA